jgi:hypothetical protein
MKLITKIIIGAVLVALVFFYAGLKYSQTQSPTASSTTRAAFVGRAGAGRGGAGAGFAGGVAGTILSVDPEGITVATTGGGSKIIFVASSTTYMKTSAGTPSDAAVGDNVVVSGSANPDGSITARSIDVRPAQAN